jgi:hypothetical protein
MGSDEGLGVARKLVTILKLDGFIGRKESNLSVDGLEQGWAKFLEFLEHDKIKTFTNVCQIVYH